MSVSTSPTVSNHTGPCTPDFTDHPYRIDMPVYPNINELEATCESFVGQVVHLSATFMGETIPVDNPNIIGDLLEDVLLPHLRKNIPCLTKGPSNAYPDFYGGHDFNIEQKAYMSSPAFDISNFQSYVNQLVEDGGVMKKLFRTIYTVYEYVPIPGGALIKKFYLLNVWKLVNYGGKYPMSMQVKNGTWLNIRPSVSSGWSDTTKTPQKFIDSIVKCIGMCSQISDKESKIKSIQDQFANIEETYNIRS
jgi:hypothetical protein